MLKCTKYNIYNIFRGGKTSQAREKKPVLSVLFCRDSKISQVYWACLFSFILVRGGPWIKVYTLYRVYSVSPHLLQTRTLT